MKKLMFSLVVVAVAASAQAFDYYHWSTVRTGGRLDDPENWNQKVVPPAGSLDEMYYSQSSPITIKSDLTIGTLCPIQVTAPDDQPLDFNLAPYTLTLSMPSGYTAALMASHNGVARSRIALRDGTIKGTVKLMAHADVAGHELIVDGADSVFDAGMFGVGDGGYANNSVIVENGGTAYGSFEIGGQQRSTSNNVLIVRGAGSQLITRETDGTWPTVGGGGWSNRLEIADGGVYKCLNANVPFAVGRDLGWNLGCGDHNAIVVRNGTFESSAYLLAVGYGGSSNEMVVTEGSSVNVKDLFVGYYSSTGAQYAGDYGFGHRLFVSDPGTTLEATMLGISMYRSSEGRVIVTNGASVHVSGNTYVGGETSEGAYLYLGSDVSARFDGLFNVGHGSGTGGNCAVFDGTFVDKTGDSSVNVGFYGHNGLLELRNGATLIHTNTLNACYVGQVSGASGNVLRIASGSTMKCTRLEVGSSAGAGSNTLELDNGSYVSTPSGIEGEGTPFVIFDRDQPEKPSWLILKGTNSTFSCGYGSYSNIRYGIPSEGLAVDKTTAPVANLGYVAGAPTAVTVDVDGKCPRGKWLLASWSDSLQDFTAQDFIDRTTLTGEGAERAQLIAGTREVYLKMRSDAGLTVILR